MRSSQFVFNFYTSSGSHPDPPQFSGDRRAERAPSGDLPRSLPAPPGDFTVPPSQFEDPISPLRSSPVPNDLRETSRRRRDHRSPRERRRRSRSRSRRRRGSRRHRSRDNWYLDRREHPASVSRADAIPAGPNPPPGPIRPPGVWAVPPRTSGCFPRPRPPMHPPQSSGHGSAAPLFARPSVSVPPTMQRPRIPADPPRRRSASAHDAERARFPEQNLSFAPSGPHPRCPTF